MDAMELLSDDNDIIEAKLLLVSLSGDVTEQKNIQDLCKSKNHTVGQIEVFELLHKEQHDLLSNNGRQVKYTLTVFPTQVYCLHFYAGHLCHSYNTSVLAMI